MILSPLNNISEPSGDFITVPILSERHHMKETKNGNIRLNIKEGLTVSIVLKEDQKSGKLTNGIVRDILTKSPAHPHGIKVRLASGEVGRVKEI